jgi:hypothetical protein
VYRRICFLRTEGHVREAQLVMDTEFAEAAARAREMAASGSDADSMLETLLAEEELRVAQAVAFAEVLVPMLSARLSALVPAPRVSAPPAAPRERKPAQDDNRGIADFIDDMLAQERTGTR